MNDKKVCHPDTIPSSSFLYISDYRPDSEPTETGHQELNSITQNTRHLMAMALDKRGLAVRYGRPAWSDGEDAVDRMHDVGLMMHPLYTDLHYVDTLVQLYSSSSASEPTIRSRADQVKRKIKSTLKKLVIEVLKEQDRCAAAKAAAGGGVSSSSSAGTSSDSPPAAAGDKRKADQQTVGKAFGKKGQQEAHKLAKIFQRPMVHSRHERERQDDVCVRAEQVVTHYIDNANSNDIGLDYTIKQTVSYWRDVGHKLFPEIAEVAMSILAFPGGSGNLERDFCKSGNLIIKQRGSMDYR